MWRRYSKPQKVLELASAITLVLTFLGLLLGWRWISNVIPVGYDGEEPNVWGLKKTLWMLWDCQALCYGALSIASLYAHTPRWQNRLLLWKLQGMVGLSGILLLSALGFAGGLCCLILTLLAAALTPLVVR